MPVPEQKFHVPLLCFGQLFQREFERRVVQSLTELGQRILSRFAEFAGGRYGLAATEGNLHLDPDSANLTSSVLQHNDKLRRKLTQFGGNRGVAGGDGERA